MSMLHSDPFSLVPQGRILKQLSASEMLHQYTNASLSTHILRAGQRHGYTTYLQWTLIPGVACAASSCCWQPKVDTHLVSAPTATTLSDLTQYERYNKYPNTSQC